MRLTITVSSIAMLETKYRDIADGNPTAATLQQFFNLMLETKYRDIADGNAQQKLRQPRIS